MFMNAMKQEYIWIKFILISLSFAMSKAILGIEPIENQYFELKN